MKRTHITIVNQGVDFIVDNLFEKITVEMIADHCCFSRHYFNRLFKSVTNESVYRFIKRLRVESAAFKLIKFPQLSITNVAVDLGFSSSNFAVLFKDFYGMSPSQFRANPRLPLKPESQLVLERIRDLQKNTPEALLKQMDQNISFETLPDIRLAYQRFKGNYQNLPFVWHTFCEEMEREFPDAPIVFFGISYDDPLIVGEDKCLYDLCAQVTPSANIKGENYRTLQGGPYLCYHFSGPVKKLSRLYNDLFAIWMPHRGYVMGPGLCFEHYHAGVMPEGYINMDLCVPIL